MKDHIMHYVRDHPYIMSATFWDFWPPPRPLSAKSVLFVHKLEIFFYPLPLLRGRHIWMTPHGPKVLMIPVSNRSSLPGTHSSAPSWQHASSFLTPTDAILDRPINAFTTNISVLAVWYFNFFCVANTQPSVRCSMDCLKYPLVKKGKLLPWGMLGGLPIN